MNSLELVLATLSGRPLARRAVAPVLSLYGARLTQCPLDQYYTDAGSYVRGQFAVLETFQPDVLFSPFAFASIGAAFGSDLHFFADQPPNIRRPAVPSAAAWDDLIPPDPETHPQLLFFREAIRRMAAEYRGQVPVAAVLPPPIDLPALIMGIEAWLETLLFDTDAARRIMDKTVPFFVNLANSFLADGAAFLASPCAFASPAIVTRDIAETFARPVMEKALAQLKGPIALHHGGARILRHLDVLTGLPSTIAFALGDGDDLAQARRIVGPIPVLFGGPSGPNLGRLTVGQVEDQCRGILEDRRQDSRFLLYTSAADIPLDAPPENIKAIRNAAVSFGKIDA